MKRIVLVGCGNLGTMIAEGVKERLRNEYEITAVCDSRKSNAENMAGILKVPAVDSLEEIIKLKPDLVVEAASKEVVKQMAPNLLASGIDMVILSVGALADETLVEQVKEAGQRTGARLHVASGAVGGFDLMRAVGFGGLTYAQIHTTKNPRSLNGAPYLDGTTLSEEKECLVFEGSAREAIKGFPQNVNVAVSTALATLGVDDTRVKISSAPGVKTNTHDINLSGEFGNVEIKVSVKPSKENPKSSALAAWSVLALLEKMSQVICL